MNDTARALLPELRWTLLVICGLLFLVGIPLVLFSGSTDEYFAWTIQPPLTAAYLGGIYWASLFGLAAAAREQWWVQARAILPASFTFTTLTLIATLIHLDRFHTSSPRAWAWIAVYVVTPPLLVALTLRQLRVPGDDPPRRLLFATWTKAVLVLQALVVLPVGLALFLVPETADGLWPWQLTPLTGRAVGAGLIGLGIAAVHALYENDWARVGGPAISFLVFGILELVAVLRYTDTVDWDTSEAWILIAFLMSFLALGLESLRQRSRNTP